MFHSNSAYSNIFKLVFLFNFRPTTSLTSYSASNYTSPIDIISQKSTSLCPKQLSNKNVTQYSIFYGTSESNAKIIASISPNGSVNWFEPDFQDTIKFIDNSFHLIYNSSSLINQQKIACEAPATDNISECTSVACIKTRYLWWKYDKQLLDKTFKLNYCRHNDKFVSNIIKNVENGMLECKKDHTFIPRKAGIDLKYFWILTRKKSFNDDKVIIVGTNESDSIEFSKIWRKKVPTSFLPNFVHKNERKWKCCRNLQRYFTCFLPSD